MDYIAQIQHQIEILRAANETMVDPQISIAIAQLSEKAFYISLKKEGKG